MPALIEITSWHWIGFIACVLVFLALDLGVFHREAHVVKFKEALAWTSLWFTLAMCFGAALVPLRGKQEAVEFLTGYIIEFSLSMDNVFVIALIFTHFRVPREYQHRVLFWGILGALVMRGVMIWGGVELIGRFEWLLYLLGGFLILSGLKMLAGGEEPPHPERNLAVRLARRLFPISRDYEGQRFITRVNGKLALTPMAIVLVMVETTDLIFAVDSIPAIFGVTRDAFIVFTSNVFAILGLRSLYFVLAGAIAFFRYLKVGLSLVLVFIGVKMVMLYWDVHIPTGWSLGFVVFIILMSILSSVWVARWKQQQVGDDVDSKGP
jgi:tellurite resistance protein TerC